MPIAVDRFDLTPKEAVAAQRELRERVIPHTPNGFAPRRIAGLDLSMERGNPIGYAGMVVVDLPTLETVDEVSLAAPLTFPYVSGLLSFRELPLLAQVWAQRTVTPDVLIFDGQGIAHPRRFGVASHGGVLFDRPSIGCAKTILVGEHERLAPEAGARAPLVHKGEVVGMAVRLRAKVAPVFVSVGHLIDLETAVAIVESVSIGFRLPETTRRAHDLVNVARRAHRAR